MHEFEGKKYGLKVAQEPIRARMCGFGDKVRDQAISVKLSINVRAGPKTDNYSSHRSSCDF